MSVQKRKRPESEKARKMRELREAKKIKEEEERDRNQLEYYIENNIIVPYDLYYEDSVPLTEEMDNIKPGDGWVALDLGEGRCHLQGKFSILYCTIPFEEFYPSQEDEYVHPLYRKTEFRSREYLVVCRVVEDGTKVIYRLRDRKIFNSFTQAINKGYEDKYLPERIRDEGVDRTKTRRSGYEYVKDLADMKLSTIRKCEENTMKRPPKQYQIIKLLINKGGRIKTIDQVMLDSSDSEEEVEEEVDEEEDEEEEEEEGEEEEIAEKPKKRVHSEPTRDEGVGIDRSIPSSSESSTTQQQNAAFNQIDYRNGVLPFSNPSTPASATTSPIPPIVNDPKMIERRKAEIIEFLMDSKVFPQEEIMPLMWEILGEGLDVRTLMTNAVVVRKIFVTQERCMALNTYYMLKTAWP